MALHPVTSNQAEAAQLHTNAGVALPARQRARAPVAPLTVAAAACPTSQSVGPQPQVTPAWARSHGLLLQALHGHILGIIAEEERRAQR